MLEWKDLEAKYGWLLDVEKAKQAKETYDLSVCKLFYDSAKETIDKFGINNCPEWIIDLYGAASETLEYGTLVGFTVDFQTFGEYSRRYLKALTEVCKIAHEHKDTLETA